MPTVLFPLNYLSRLTNRKAKELEKSAFEYGLEAIVREEQLEVEVTAERPDLLSAVGFIRAMTVFDTGEIRNLPEKLPASNKKIIVSNSVRELRPHIGGLIVENIDLKEPALTGLLQFLEKVTQTFGRLRRKAAVGVYDLSRIAGEIHFTSEDKQKFSFVPIHSELILTAEQILSQHPMGIKYADALPNSNFVPVLKDQSDQVLSMPPILNSAFIGEVSEETNNLFIDVTGTSARTVKELLSIIAHDLIDMGAQVKTVTTVYDNELVVSPDIRRQEITVSFDKLNHILGTQLASDNLNDYLRRTDLKYSGDTVFIPSYRTDILNEVDIAGDLLVSIGTNNLQSELPVKSSLGKSHPMKDLCSSIGGIAQRLGFIEVKTFLLTNPEHISVFSNSFLQTLNAKSRTYSACRPSLYPGLIELLSNQANVPKPLNVYEIGEVLIPTKTSVSENVFFSFASLDSGASFASAKAFLQILLKTIGVQYEITTCSESMYINGRAAKIIISGTPAGHFGEIHPRILNTFSISDPICAGELNCHFLSGDQKKLWGLGVNA